MQPEEGQSRYDVFSGSSSQHKVGNVESLAEVRQLKVLVDYDLCKGYGECAAAAPEVFTVDDNGNMTVLQEAPAEALREKVEQAVEYCPTFALEIGS